MRRYEETNVGIHTAPTRGEPEVPLHVSVTWFDSLGRRDFDNAAVLDEIRQALKRLAWLDR